MGIISFMFDKMSVEKTSSITGNVNINHNFNIKNVKKSDINIEGSKATLKLYFDFNVNYEPNIGNIQINGNLIYLDKEEELDKLDAQWKKEKRLPEDVTNLVANTILTKANVKALMLSQEVNLPPQIHLPKVTIKNEESKKEDYIG